MTSVSIADYYTFAAMSPPIESKHKNSKVFKKQKRLNCISYTLLNTFQYGVLPNPPTKNFIPPLFLLKHSFLRQ